jgi:hypothetical protein
MTKPVRDRQFPIRVSQKKINAPLQFSDYTYAYPLYRQI